VADDDQSSLIADLKRRDPAAWSTVVDRQLGEVYGFVFHLCRGDRAAAEDLTQETWLEAIESIHDCDSARGSFRNWLLGIARRRVALYFRRRAGRKDFHLLGDFTEEDPEAGAILPLDVLEQVERASAIRAALLVLPADRRAVLLCKYVEGLSVEMIAHRLGRTAESVESLLTRARNQMRSLLSGYLETPGGAQVPIRRPSNE
jgi:RNA polymerase sigma-70 factor (ECF subfamily)